MNRVTFVLGGCRSGKSRHAQELAEAASDRGRLFIATCVPRDEEMMDRVRRHQADRGGRWETVESPMALPEAITDAQTRAGVVLVDCLTLWASNILLDPETERTVDARVARLVEVLGEVRCPTFVVSNETGLGIVPDNPLARRFRDLVGFLNQRMAATADDVIWMTAGIPMKIK